MKIASNNNTIQYNTIQYNNLGLMNDFQNKNIKYNTGDIEQDSFVKPATTMTNSVSISFGNFSIKEFWQGFMKLKNKVNECINNNDSDKLEEVGKRLDDFARENIKNLNPNEKDDLLIELMKQY